MVLISWIRKQPNRVGCTVRTLMGRQEPAEPPVSGEAADTRPRGGQWRASKPEGLRCDRTARRELPSPTGPRRSRHEWIETAGWHEESPHLSVRGGRQM